MSVMYYTGHLVVDILGGDYDRAGDKNPLYRHNRFPFARFVDYPVDKDV